MELIANDICAIISDYQNEVGVQLTPQNVLDWVSQFEENDQEFILTEFLHLLNNGIYISRSKAKKLLYENIASLARQWGYSDITNFLKETSFLNIQRAGKSQPELIALLRELILELGYIEFNEGIETGFKNFIYVDDILATGNTIYNDISAFLAQTISDDIKFVDLLLANKIRISVSVFCVQSWGMANTRWRLMKTFSDSIKSKILFRWNYEIQNHPSFQNQVYNHIYPQLPQPKEVTVYLASLTAERHGNIAFRGANKPAVESFFSSSANRIKFENIILLKGLQIIEKINKTPNPGLRPLGFISPSYKTLGLGTLFFTWRNIPNNCPLVFWWRVTGHEFVGLFPVKGRGE
ncbi:MAG: hypothetical protein MUC87_22400 [Bacteroidia bacterium]|jgi:hypothetical protein|nr:hypothetical protein [Bacteroidia bacterium]